VCYERADLETLNENAAKTVTKTKMLLTSKKTLVFICLSVTGRMRCTFRRAAEGQFFGDE